LREIHDSYTTSREATPSSGSIGLGFGLLVIPKNSTEHPFSYAQSGFLNCKQASCIDQEFRLQSKLIHYVATPAGTQTPRLSTAWLFVD
jgi:hypothetical protein